MPQSMQKNPPRHSDHLHSRSEHYTYTMTEAEWAVIGASGKPKKGARQKAAVNDGEPLGAHTANSTWEGAAPVLHAVLVKPLIALLQGKPARRLMARRLDRAPQACLGGATQRALCLHQTSPGPQQQRILAHRSSEAGGGSEGPAHWQSG